MTGWPSEILDFDEALAAWRKLRPEDRYDREPPSRSPETPGCCPVCHFPLGLKGYVRLRFPMRHPMFGRLIRCPRCCEGRRE